PFDFTLPTDTGELLTLSSLRGRPVILYFYPKDDTPGCTIESCELRDLFPAFSSTDAVILGISPDSVESHRKFKAKFSLPFTLLVDEGHALAEQLGLWVEKSMYGQKYMGVQRTTFVIGADGAVQHVFEKVNPAGHADEVMAFLQGGLEAAQQVRAGYDAAVKHAKDVAAAAEAAKAPAKAPAKKPAKKPAAKKSPAKPAAKRAVKKPVKQAAKKTAKKVAKRVAKKVAKTAVKKTAKKPVKKPVKKAVKKPARKVVKHAAKRPARKIVKKPAPKAKKTKKAAHKK
ncbi:MAG: thioredoxin-dependent thiol peroxidase, partial [Gemmatimonadaceae bacterium]